MDNPFENIPPKGMSGPPEIKAFSFMSEDDIRLNLLIMAYKGRIQKDWTLKQVEDELNALEDIFYGPTE